VLQNNSESPLQSMRVPCSCNDSGTSNGESSHARGSVTVVVRVVVGTIVDAQGMLKNAGNENAFHEEVLPEGLSNMYATTRWRLNPTIGLTVPTHLPVLSVLLKPVHFLASASPAMPQLPATSSLKNRKSDT